jgi:serum/glucocorticoid-regulated kinase 2
MAPEIVSRQNYSFGVDLYCIGALLYEILIGCPPFYNPNFSNNETKYHICNSEVTFPNKLTLSEKVKDLIASLLVRNQNQRLGHLEGVK